MVAVILRARQGGTNQFPIGKTFLFGGRTGRNRIHGFSHSGAYLMHTLSRKTTTAGDPVNVCIEGVKFYLTYHRSVPKTIYCSCPRGRLLKLAYPCDVHAYCRRARFRSERRKLV